MTAMTADATFNPTTSPEKILSGLLGLMKDLKSVYQEEVDAMSRNDTNKFMSLQPSKIALSRDYEIRVKEVQARAAAIKEADPFLRQMVVIEQTELAALADKSQSGALRMAEAIKRLQERLIYAAREAISQEKLQYGKNGHMKSGEIGKPAATSINQDF